MNLGQLFLLFGITVDHQSFGQAMVALTILKSAASALTSVISQAAHGLIDMAMEAAKAGTHMMGFSAGLGISTRSVQEWDYVAQQAGTNMTNFARGLGMFERNLLAFSRGRGSKNFKDAMKLIGVSTQDATRDLMGPDGMNPALFKISDRYKELGLNAFRGAENQALFGARNREMAHDLGRGSGLLKEQIKHLHDIGGVVSDSSVQNLKKFDNSINDIKISFNSLATQVVGDLAPSFTKMLKEVTAWIVENKTLISDVLRAGFEVLTIAFHMLFAVVKALAWLIEGVMNGDLGAITLFSLFLGMIFVVAGAIASILIPVLVAMGAVMWAAMAPLLPWGLLIAAIIVGIILLVTHWSQVVQFFKDNWLALLVIFLPFIGIPLLIIKHWETVKGWFAAFFHWFMGILRESGEGWVIGWHKFTDEMSREWHNLGDTATSVIDAIADAARIGWSAVKDFFDPLGLLHNTSSDMSTTAVGGQSGAVKKFNPMAQPKPSVPKNDTEPTLTPEEQSEWDAADKKYRASLVGTTRDNAHGMPSGRRIGSGDTHISIGSTTVNIHGVKDAAEAKGHIADAIDNTHRHAAAALGGEVE